MVKVRGKLDDNTAGKFGKKTLAKMVLLAIAEPMLFKGAGYAVSMLFDKAIASHVNNGVESVADGASAAVIGSVENVTDHLTAAIGDVGKAATTATADYADKAGQAATAATTGIINATVSAAIDSAKTIGSGLIAKIGNLEIKETKEKILNQTGELFRNGGRELMIGIREGWKQSHKKAARTEKKRLGFFARLRNFFTGKGKGSSN